MKVTIKNRFTEAVLYETDVPDGVESKHHIRIALERATIRGRPADQLRELREETQKAIGQAFELSQVDGRILELRLEAIDGELAAPSPVRPNLGDAYLGGAYLGDAYLRGANLGGAYLGGANLRGAYLRGADLRGANLGGAYLRGAYLGGAYLGGAYLGDADLRGANAARLEGAYLADAKNLPPGIEPTDPPVPYRQARAASAPERVARFRERHPEIPAIEKLDAKILDAVTGGGGRLYMRDWHRDGSCGTTHCRAGWAIHLAGPAGYDLERRLGPEQAGRLIYLASTGEVPDFFAGDQEALEDIKACAAAQVTAIEAP